MPRKAWRPIGGICYHVSSRGNLGAEVFHDAEDYEGFEVVLGEACEQVPVRVLGYCLLPAEYQLVLWPRADGDLSRFMQWMLTTHVRRYRSRHGGAGHVWAGRYRACPVQQDEHLRAVLRHVERGGLREGRVRRAENWAWSSLRWWVQPAERPAFLHAGPVPRGAGWVAAVNRPLRKTEQENLEACLKRGRPYGTPRWQKLTAAKLGLDHTLRPRGRPRKHPLQPARKAKK